MNGIVLGIADDRRRPLAEGFVIKDNTGIMTSMTVDEYGIGYVSLSSASMTDQSDAFRRRRADSEQNVMNDTYGLSAIQLDAPDAGDYPKVKTVEELVNAFVAFIGTTDVLRTSSTTPAPSPSPRLETWDDYQG